MVAKHVVGIIPPLSSKMIMFIVVVTDTITTPIRQPKKLLVYNWPTPIINLTPITFVRCVFF